MGTAVTYFDVIQEFAGTLEPQQPGVVVVKTDPNFVSTSNETTLVTKLHDPYNYLAKGANVTWSWFNSTSFIMNTTTPSLKQNITKEGTFYYNVTVSGEFDSSLNPNKTLIRRGSFETNVVAKGAYYYTTSIHLIKLDFNYALPCSAHFQFYRGRRKMVSSWSFTQSSRSV